MQHTPSPQVADRCPDQVQAPLFPAREADAEAYRAWLAHAPWPEVIFGARAPAPASQS